MIGAALAVGLLAKLNFIALLPGAAPGRGAARVARAPRCIPAPRRARRGGGVRHRRAPWRWSTWRSTSSVWDRTAWGGGVGIAARTAAGTGSHASDAITLVDQLNYTWQLYLPRLPGHGRRVLPLPRWETWYHGFIGEFGWLDTTFDLWVYRVSLLVIHCRSCSSPGPLCSVAGPRSRGRLAGDPHLRRARGRPPRFDRRAGVPLPPEHRLRVRAGALPAAAPAALRGAGVAGRGDRRRAPLRPARRRGAGGAGRGARRCSPSCS